MNLPKIPIAPIVFGGLALGYAVLMCMNKPFNPTELDELVQGQDGQPGYSYNDITDLSINSGISVLELEADLSENGRIDYQNFPQRNLEQALIKYQEQK